MSTSDGTSTVTGGKQSMALNLPLMGPTAMKTRIAAMPTENMKEKQVSLHFTS
jgi:hypothetical protein